MTYHIKIPQGMTYSILPLSAGLRLCLFTFSVQTNVQVIVTTYGYKQISVASQMKWRVHVDLVVLTLTVSSQKRYVSGNKTPLTTLLTHSPCLPLSFHTQVWSGQGWGNRHRKDWVLAYGSHEVLEKTQIPEEKKYVFLLAWNPSAILLLIKQCMIVIDV